MNSTIFLKTKQLWSSVVDNYNDKDEIFLPVIVGWSIMFIVYWLFGLFLLFAETSGFKVFAIHKHQSNSPLSFQKTKYAPSFKTLMKGVFFNWTCVILPTLYVTQKLLKQVGLGVYVSKELPGLGETILKLAIALPLSDIFFYTSHYILHKPWFYKRIHKIHHEYKAPYGLCAIYAHWFEALVGNTLALMSIAFIVNMHCLVWWIVGSLGWLNTVADHSGLDLPLMPATKRKFRHLLNQHGRFGFTDFHDYHHQYFTGNYGVGLFMDRLFGTHLGWKKKCIETDRKQRKLN